MIQYCCCAHFPHNILCILPEETNNLHTKNPNFFRFTLIYSSMVFTPWLVGSGRMCHKIKRNEIALLSLLLILLLNPNLLFLFDKLKREFHLIYSYFELCIIRFPVQRWRSNRFPFDVDSYWYLLRYTCLWGGSYLPENL
jgi:hypothetical protein